MYSLVSKIGSWMSSVVIALGSLVILTPVLHTLTVQFSTDTIAACTVCCLAAHLFFMDYGFVNGDSQK
jgi:hypothetical protein